ncbi:hypothetical protein PCE1_001265 [Barthelona sp. PCE]
MVDMFETMFSLRFAKKQMERNARKSAKRERRAKDRVQRAVEDGDIQKARIYAENAIRYHQEEIQSLKHASTLDVLCSRVEMAAMTERVSKHVEVATKSMMKAMESTDMTSIFATMGNFNQVCEDLDIATDYMGEVVGQSTMTSQLDVDRLIKEVADEHEMSLGEGLVGLTVGTEQVAPIETTDTPSSIEQKREAQALL